MLIMSDDRLKKKREISRLRVARFRQLRKQEAAEKRREYASASTSQQTDIEEHSYNEHNDDETIGIAHGDGDFSETITGDIPSTERASSVSDESEANDDISMRDDHNRATNNLDRISISAHSSDASNDSNDEAYNDVIANDSDESEGDEERYDEIQELRLWAQNTQIPHAHLDGLLGILRQRLLPELPKTAKTFLDTNNVGFNIRRLIGRDDCDGGELVYFGIATYLQQIVNVRLHEEPVLDLLFNIDGLPLYKSSSKQFWPILCKLFFLPDLYQPFPVAIYAGNGKPPDVGQFLEDFIEEINRLQRDGIIIEDRLFQIRIKNFICDRPARAFMKCIIGHGGYFACERCMTRGERVNNRTIYPSIHAEHRTKMSFRNQENREHHHGVSPLLLIEPAVDMVTQFSLDFMHLCCLGIMKKMFVDFWLNSKVTTQLSQNSKRVLSNILLLLKPQIPEDFQRTTRSLDDLAKWKATEFRLFLLYIGPIVLKKVLVERLYQHFLLFHVGCRMLCSTDLALAYNDEAKQCLQTFFILAGQLYGAQSQIMNMHSLIHLADDAKNMNCSLTYLTAFPFENALGKLKKMIRSGNKPLAQVCRRLHERFYTDFKKPTLSPTYTILKSGRPRDDGSLPITKLKYKGLIISNKLPNNGVVLSNGTVLQIQNMYKTQEENTIEIEGTVLSVKRSIYTYPCDSSIFKMWRVKKTQRKKTTMIESIDRKMMILDLSDLGGEKIYAVSLIHDE